MPTNHYYNRPAPVLPPVESLPYPANFIVECAECGLRSSCQRPVPSDNCNPCDVMLVGEAPGRNEDEQGRPFVGMAGQYLDSLLFQCGVSREAACISNIVHCRPPNNRTPKAEEIRACSRWLELELDIVQPRIIVALGKPATDVFLPGNNSTMEHLHGKPVEKDGRIILPGYHPAFALRDTSKMRQVSEDFQVLRGLVKGRNWHEYHVVDEYPDPVYRVADIPEKVAEMERAIESAGEFAVDTEICRGKLWSVQISCKEGEAYFIPIKDGYEGKVDLSHLKATTIVHNFLFDITYLKLSETNFSDTMTLAYLCVARGTPILRADLSWCRADSVKAGDELVGFDESYKTRSRHDNRSCPRRKMRRSTVNHSSIHSADCFTIELSDGRSVTCTGDHMWLANRMTTCRTEWLTTTEIANRMKTGLYRIRSVVPRVWDTANSYEAGWLAGILDGEGCIRGKKVSGAQVTIAQKSGAVLDKIDLLTRKMGFRYINKIYKGRVVSTVVIPSLPQSMHLLGSVRPVRFPFDFWEGKELPTSHTVDNFAVIMSIRPIGTKDVVAINTTTGTYVANGLASHNCGQPQGLKELSSRLCGIPMKSYNEIVRPGQQELSLEYLLKAAGMEWPDPPTIEETKWDNKKGCLVTKNRKPWHISRRINKMLDDYGKDDNTDLWDRWRNIPEEERVVVEGVIGAMPESSLADIDFSKAVAYACRDSDSTLRVYHKLKKMITDLDLDFVLDMDLNILPMVNSMMQNGMAVDLDHLRKLSEDYDVRMRVMSEELAGRVGHPFNPNSSDQVAEVVYKELVDAQGHPYKPTKMTPTDKVSTDDAELKKTGHPIAKDIIRYRGIQKLKSTYADALIEWARPDEQGVPRVHTTIKTTRVETGRLASADPNLQNIPTRNKEAKAIKNGFVAPDGWLLGEGDLGQIEMRTQAHLAQCKGLIELFLSSKDPHTTTASRIFGVSYEEAGLNKYRYPTKRAGFGIIYMIGAHGLSTQINEYIADLEMEGEPVDIDPWDETMCQKFIDDYYLLYPEIRDYQQEKLAEARRYGYVRDPISGRIRYIPEVTCPIRSVAEGGARMAANFPVTTSAQAIIKSAMGRLWQGLPKTEWSDAKCLLQIHDSLIWEMLDDEDYYVPFLRWMRDVMCNVISLSVPIEIDFKIGKKWGELKGVEL